MQQEEINYLIDKYLNGTASSAEKGRLLRWYRESNEQVVEWPSSVPNEDILVKERVLAGLKEQIRVQKTNNRGKFWLRVAASVAIILSTGLGFWYYHSERLPDSGIANSRFKNDIPHGGHKAILKLADGSEIILDNAGKGIVSQQGNVLVSKSADGQIVYEFTGASEAGNLLNTVSTPKGGEFQVVLSDGTRAWLNSGSSITFPAAFSGSERHVQIAGEVYFEVAKNKHKPFKVGLKDMEIEVLGTHFNVMAYEDEYNTATTLLEGSVKVKTLNSKTPESKILIPGQQASLTHAHFDIKKVDMEEVMAWKNGYFMFNNENIQSVMRKLSRWYNVEVEYEGNVANRAIWGTVSRFQNASQVLTMLELTGVIRFKIEGRRITVMP